MGRIRILLLALFAALVASTPAFALEGPSAPRVAAETGNGSIDVVWSEAAEGDLPITKYRIARIPAFSDGQDRFMDTSERSLRDLDLVNGTTYTYYVSAIDMLGTEGPAGSDSATAGIPLAPQDFRADVKVHGDKMYVRLSWSPPLVTNGDILRYNVYRYPLPEPIASIQGENLSYLDVIPRKCSDVEYYVTAVNRHGEGHSSERIPVRSVRCPWG